SGEDRTLLRRLLDDARDRLDATPAIDQEVEGAIRQMIGEAYHALALDHEAERQLVISIERLRAARGSEDDATLLAALTLGRSLGNLGRFDEADALYRDVLDSTSDRSAADPLRLEAEVRRGLSLVLLGRLAQAESWLLATLDRHESALGAEAPETLRAVVFVSRLREEQGQIDEAEALARRAVEGFHETLGADHARSLVAEQRLAMMVARRGRDAEAVVLLSAALERQLRVLGESHRTTFTTTRELAKALRRTGDAEAALSHLESAVELHRRRYGSAHIETYRHLMAAGLAARDARRSELALERYAEAVEVAERVPDAPDRYAGYAIGSTGFALMDLGRFDEAEAALLEGRERLVAAEGETHAYVKSITRHLVRLYERTERAREAERWQARLVASAAE
ncbi:MAG: tetratricopeptide repeat protein, partial [Planctomycetota bacterium]